MTLLGHSNLIPIILSGGSGSRLWPLSRKSYPKQFRPLHGNSELSLLQKTINSFFIERIFKKFSSYKSN